VNFFQHGQGPVTEEVQGDAYQGKSNDFQNDGSLTKIMTMTITTIDAKTYSRHRALDGGSGSVLNSASGSGARQ
jgi:hypothetical protein